MQTEAEHYVILSDIHANDVALEAVLARIAELEQQYHCQFSILINGDFLDAGPSPVRTLNLLQECSQVFVAGNHEEYLLDCARHPKNQRYQDKLWQFVPWTVEEIGRPRLEALAKQLVFSWHSSDGVVNLVHASRESNAKVPEFFGAQNIANNALPDVQKLECDKVFFAGHSHYLGVHWEPGHRNLWINSGSVGFPFVKKSAERADTPASTFVWVKVNPGTSGAVSASASALAPAPATAFGGGRAKAGVEVHFECIFYCRKKLIEGYLNSGALQNCAPYSVAVLAQSLFNIDLVFPFFQNARKQGISQPKLAGALVHFLQTQKVVNRLQRVFAAEGHPFQTFEVES